MRRATGACLGRTRPTMNRSSPAWARSAGACRPGSRRGVPAPCRCLVSCHASPPSSGRIQICASPRIRADRGPREGHQPAVGRDGGFTSRTAPDVRRLGAAAGHATRPQVRDVAATADLPQAVDERSPSEDRLKDSITAWALTRARPVADGMRAEYAARDRTKDSGVTARRPAWRIPRERHRIVDPFPRPVPCSADQRPDGGQIPSATTRCPPPPSVQKGRFDAQLIVGQALRRCGCDGSGAVRVRRPAAVRSAVRLRRTAAEQQRDRRHGAHRHGRVPGLPQSGNGLLEEAYTLYELVYDTPIAVNQAGDFVPELATEWSVSDDGLTWTMTIRDDAVFHDGTPLTAEDVAFSIQLYKDTPDFPYLPSYATCSHHRGHRCDDGDPDHEGPDRELRGQDGLHVRPAQAHLGGRGGMS